MQRFEIQFSRNHIYGLPEFNVLLSTIKPVLSGHWKRRPKIVFQDWLSLDAGQKYCRMHQGEYSAILSTFIKLPFVIKIFVLSIFEGHLKDRFYCILTPYILVPGQVSYLSWIKWDQFRQVEHSISTPLAVCLCSSSDHCPRESTNWAMTRDFPTM